MRRLTPWLGLLVVVGAAYAVVGVLWVAAQPPSLGFDLLLVRSAGERLLQGEPIYVDPAGLSFLDPGPEDFYGPPALAVLGVPLSLLPAELVRLAAFPGSLAVFAAGLAALGASVVLGRDAIAGVFIGAMVSFAVFWGATLGASSVWLFGLLAFAIVALGRGSEVAAGVLIGTAAALRIYPVVLLLPLAVAGRWRAVLAAIATIVAWGAVGILVAGVDATRTFVELLVELQGTDAESSSIALTGTARVGSLVAGVILLAWGGWRARGDERRDALVGWGLALGGMLLVTPVVWDHYTTALLPLVVAVVSLTGFPVAGVLSIGMLPAAQAGGLIMFWLPIVAVVVDRWAARRAEA
jgi:alpha-1,2-mannosyltransferase